MPVPDAVFDALLTERTSVECTVLRPSCRRTFGFNVNDLCVGGWDRRHDSPGVADRMRRLPSMRPSGAAIDMREDLLDAMKDIIMSMSDIGASRARHQRR